MQFLCAPPIAAIMPPVCNGASKLPKLSPLGKSWVFGRSQTNMKLSPVRGHATTPIWRQGGEKRSSALSSARARCQAREYKSRVGDVCVSALFILQARETSRSCGHLGVKRFLLYPDDWMSMGMEEWFMKLALPCRVCLVRRPPEVRGVKFSLFVFYKKKRKKKKERK